MNDFAADLLASLPDAAARAAAERVLQRWAGSTLYLPKDRGAAPEQRVRAACLLLAGDTSTTDAATVLMQRFGCSRRTAQGDVAKAAQRVQESLRVCG